LYGFCLRLGVLVVHFFSVEIHLTAEARRWGNLLAVVILFFETTNLLLGVAFLWLMLSSMAFEGTFVWVLPINVVLIALVVSIEFWIAS